MSKKTKHVIANIVLAITFGIAFWGFMIASLKVVYGYYLHAGIAVAIALAAIFIANEVADYIICGKYAKPTRRL